MFAHSSQEDCGARLFLLHMRVTSPCERLQERGAQNVREHNGYPALYAVNENERSIKVTISVPLGPKQPIFTTKEEDEMVTYLKHGRTSFWTYNSRSATSSISTGCENSKTHNFNTDEQRQGLIGSKFAFHLTHDHDHAVSAWLRSHPRRLVAVFQISEIFGNAYIQAATTSTAINAFRKCGIWPYNQNNFTDADFISTATTYIQNI
ncbi:uncharacterized protein LOC119837251 [Zerene cesonia]|uniref:uncharacterized protein LOC119837251 n=1 Tax=Zerene cesonia TaxID=33412 RepID=UPI0018E580CF|nr:uncharacterized protein LOC119837251 [Zerene cesonia]